ncbi:MAG: hypothetical protein BGP07_03175 [Rhizobiales bacterium 63-22]|nr:MAG: hypothetical protein BGP07_03175 [Rhizobiales bacterium 63-22]
MIQFQAAKRPIPPHSCKSSLVDRLADTMREMAFAGENVTPETLESRGYPRDVVRRLGERAAALARRRSVRRVA